MRRQVSISVKLLWFATYDGVSDDSAYGSITMPSIGSLLSSADDGWLLAKCAATCDASGLGLHFAAIPTLW